jgi:ribonuclease HII
VESALHEEGFCVVAGVDEVGRGSLSGPVTVGVVVVGPADARPPRGLRDSKLLTPEARRALVPRIKRWVRAWSVGHAAPEEIDAYGVIAALRLAGHRALAGLPQLPDCVLLDGNHDYLTPPAQLELVASGPEPDLLPSTPTVRTRIKADLTCASVAAASVLAKTTRDALMVDLAREHPDYGWDVNKGYATPFHRAALRRLGPTRYHRLTWRLGLDDGLSEDALDELGDELVDELAALADGEGRTLQDVDQHVGQDADVVVSVASREVRA